MLTEIVARNMWIAPQRGSCEYFDDVQNLIAIWPMCNERLQITLNAESFINTLSSEYPMVYEYVRTHYYGS
jgi:hypothetical protein